MEVEGLRVLAERGEIALLASEMRRRWAYGDAWSPEDAVQVAVLLVIAAEAPGADTLYANFCEPLKRHHEAVQWLGTLKMRARAIEIFEGLDATVTWLQESAAATSKVEVSASGYPLALAARRLRIAGREKETAPLLRSAVNRALSGLGWYRSEILSEMGHYQLQIGHIDLAFEYFRAVFVQEYMRGTVSADELEKMCGGLAEMLGQVDYQIELKRNIAEQGEKRAHPIPMVAWSTVAAHLATIGVWGEAQSALRRAAAIGDAGKRQVDRSFGAYCRAWARVLDPQEVSAADVAAACRDATRVFGEMLPLPRSDEVAAWGAMLREVRETRGDASHLAAAIILTTMRARQAEASGRIEDALSLYAEIGYRGEAPCQLASERRARILLTLGRHDEVLSHAPEWRAVATKAQTTRYGSEVLIGSAHLAAGDREAAYECAQRALSAWRRVLSGLYDPSHKTAWLSRGTEVFELAIRALDEPLAGLDEALRRRLLFEFCEQNKSRLIGDMLNRREYVPGPYIIAAAEQRNAVADLIDFALREAPDWLPILEIHSVAVYADAVISETWTPGVSRPTRTEEVELAPLRTTLRVSVQEDQRLLATADAVSYDVGSFIHDGELIENVSRFIPGVGS